MVETSLKVAAIQMISAKDWKSNLQQACLMIKEAAMANAKLIVLPEFFIQITGQDDSRRLDIAEVLGDGFIQQKLSQIAKECNVFLNAGTILIKASDNQYYNTSIVYNPNGELLAHYNKIHLFKFKDENNEYDESITFKAGKNIVSTDILGFNVGLSICYDLRFPELYRKMGELDLILLPSAFTYTTGKAHWEILARSRAIENQCYFIAVNQGGVHETGRHTYGHSMIIDPWGRIVSLCEEGNQIIYATIERQVIAEVRKKLPALEHRVID